MKQLEIYGTLGPSCCDYETLQEMLKLGMTGMRLNLSHCNLWNRKEWLDALHQASNNLKINPTLLIDMKGPELRLPHSIEIEFLPNGSSITFSGLYWPKEIMLNIEVNDHLLIDDGKLDLLVLKLENSFIECRVLRGGYLQGGKSIAIQGKNITGDILSQSDISNLEKALEYGVTGIMQPFVRASEDLIHLKNKLTELNLSHLKIYAKIENMEGVEHIEEIIPHCDCVVIARGDLGNATGLTQLPFIQKQLENTCKKYNKEYMIVTEMLASMQNNQIPTRAEVSDVFHAVYHGASSIMLTGETANGKYPIQAMDYFIKTAKQALEFKQCENKKS